MAIKFQRDDQGAWLYLKQEGIYELEVNITKLPDLAGTRRDQRQMEV